MTTPERLRRRQRIEGTFLVVLGILLVILGVFTVSISSYFRAQDDAQEKCFERYAAKTAYVSNLRSELVEREARNDSRFLLNATEPNQTMKGFQAERARYAMEVDKIAAARKQNPVPPYPEGGCND